MDNRKYSTKERSDFAHGTEKLLQDFRSNQSGVNELNRTNANWFRNAKSHARRWDYVSMPRGEKWFRK